jgi:hypothetical protein
MAAQSLDNTKLFEELDSYDWDNDKEFQVCSPR